MLPKAMVRSRSHALPPSFAKRRSNVGPHGSKRGLAARPLPRRAPANRTHLLCVHTHARVGITVHASMLCLNACAHATCKHARRIRRCGFTRAFTRACARHRPTKRRLTLNALFIHVRHRPALDQISKEHLWRTVKAHCQ